MPEPRVDGAYPWYRLRHAQYDEIYVSPHMDDAVYSCGGQMSLRRAVGARILVITLFGNGSSDQPGRGVFGDFAQRMREERRAMERLDVDGLWLNYPDVLYRRKRPRELLSYALPFLSLAPDALQARLLAALHALCSRLLAPSGRLYFPFAIGFHPDHRVAFEVGRALQASARWPVSFYEDIPYAHVPALRRERLHYLGFEPASSAPRFERPKIGDLYRDARQIHGFVFARAPDWQRPFSAAIVLWHLAVTRLLHRLLAQAKAGTSELELSECDIGPVIRLKVDAMRAYETQTAFFFPRGDALFDVLERADGRYVERYWRLGPRLRRGALRLRDSYLELEREKVNALLRELQREHI